MIEDPYDKLKNLSPDLVARLKARRDESQAEMRQRNEEFARTFKPRDFVHGVFRTQKDELIQILMYSPLLDGQTIMEILSM